MFARLFRRQAHRSALPRIADGLALYAIGDVHGRLDLLVELVERVAHDAAGHSGDEERRLVFLGDYIDRGPQSREVIDALLDLDLPNFKFVFLLGNHEEALLAFLDGETDSVAWLTYGGVATLASYGVSIRGLPMGLKSVAELRARLRAAIPAAHFEFLRACRLSHVEGDYVFVHAGVRPGRSLVEQEREDLLWIRTEFLKSRRALPGKVVVHGHSISNAPEDLHHRIGIDTGAYVTGRLTCLVLRDSDRRFMVTGA